jgi:hypothetical protein
MGGGKRKFQYFQVIKNTKSQEIPKAHVLEGSLQPYLILLQSEQNINGTIKKFSISSSLMLSKATNSRICVLKLPVQKVNTSRSDHHLFNFSKSLSNFFAYISLQIDTKMKTTPTLIQVCLLHSDQIEVKTNQLISYFNNNFLEINI